MSIETVNAVALKLCAPAGGDVADIGFDVDHGAEVGACGVDASDEVVRKLRDKLERYRRHRAKRAGWVRRFVPTGLWPLDERLPHGGLPCGAITELYADFAGVGSMTLALRLAGRCAEGRDEGTKGRRDEEERSRGTDHGPIVVVDTYGDFYPPAVVPFGIALDRLLVLRVRHEKDALWAAEQSLRCAAVAAVVAPLERIDDRDSRRLQLAAETSGCVGIVLRPMHRRTKSFAAVQMWVEGGRDIGTEGRWDEKDGCHGQAQRRRVDPHRVVGSAVRTGFHVDRSTALDSEVFEERALGWRDGYFCRITLLAVREGMPTSPCWVDLYHETGTCDVHPLPVDRPVAKTG